MQLGSKFWKDAKDLRRSTFKQFQGMLLTIIDLINLGKPDR